MDTRRIIQSAAVVAAFTSLAYGGVLSPTADQFAVLAGGSLSTGQGVQITNGMVGGNTVYFGQFNEIAGDVLSRGSLGSDKEGAFGGRMVAGGALSLGHHVAVTGPVHAGGGIWMDRNSVTGAVVGDQNISIGKDAQINGGVDYGTSYWFDSGVSITGIITHNTLDADTWSAASRIAPTFNPGGQSLWYGSGSQTLSPGSYQSLSTAQNVTIHLSAGVYDFSSIWLSKGAHLIADTSAGSVVVKVSGSFSTDKEVGIETTGGLLDVLVAGSASLGADNVFAGSLFTFGQNLSVAKNTEVEGSLYSAGSMWLDKDVIISGVNAASASVPEPASLAMIGIGLMCMFSRRSKHA